MLGHLTRNPVRASIAPARSAAEIAAAKALCLEYAESLGFSLCFQGFDKEMAEFPGAYAGPRGALLLATLDDAPVGVVGLRDLGDDIAEMKRLYVKPDTRGFALGRRLAEAIVDEARRRGYRALRLDTLPTMNTAIRLYRGMGFKEIFPYTHNPVEGALFLELRLKTDNKEE